MIAPIACSRTPKWTTRPFGLGRRSRPPRCPSCSSRRGPRSRRRAREGPRPRRSAPSPSWSRVASARRRSGGDAPRPTPGQLGPAIRRGTRRPPPGRRPGTPRSARSTRPRASARAVCPSPLRPAPRRGRGTAPAGVVVDLLGAGSPRRPAGRRATRRSRPWWGSPQAIVVRRTTRVGAPSRPSASRWPRRSRPDRSRPRPGRRASRTPGTGSPGRYRWRGRAALDRDPVVVEDPDQLSELLVPRDLGRLVADPLHEVAVGAEDDRVVIDDLVPRAC
jgi:hypothetical protein